MIGYLDIRLRRYEALRAEWQMLAAAREEIEAQGQTITAHLCDIALELAELESLFTGMEQAADVVAALEAEAA